MSSSGKPAVGVTVQPEGRTACVMPGTLLAEAVGRAGIVLQMPCGGLGTCGKCRVEIAVNSPSPTEVEQRHLTADELKRGVRLACQAYVDRPMSVTVPVTTRLFEQKILTNGHGREVPLHPTVSKYAVKLPLPNLKDQRADTDRLMAVLPEKEAIADMEVLRELPSALRRSNFDVTAVVAEGRIIAVESGNTSTRNYGVAFDIGTTTVVGFLLDLAAGREIAVAARTNPQTAFGDDVVSRIHYASTAAEGTKQLQRILIECLNDIVSECCAAASVPREQIYEVTVVGNTPMTHLLLGVDPTYLAQAPYVAAQRAPVNARSAEIGLQIHPNGILRILPNIAGFVGSDTVGMILASGLHESVAPTLAIDIGTNGELVLGHQNRLVSCSTAAGPAFEGARIRFGMRASDGAIDKVLIESDVEYEVIGATLPRGLCGTGLIDAVAALLRCGAADSTGRLLSPEEMPSRAPTAVKCRMVEGERGREFIIANRSETQTGEAICLTQRDIRELQLAKGAIAAGSAVLLKEFGIQAEDLQWVLLAGAFGNFIRRESAARIGLLPATPLDRIRHIGNAAGAGARMALLSRRCKEEANRISESTEYLELAGRPDFQQEFASAMLFPEE